MLLLTAGCAQSDADPQDFVNAISIPEPADYLLDTEWDIENNYSLSAPDKQALAPLSAAFGQVLFHHRLAPTGDVSYTTDSGLFVDADFRGYTPVWEEFRGTLPVEETDSENEVSKYLFSAAAALGQNFGGEDFARDLPQMLSSVESVFGCEIQRYVYSDESFPNRRDEIIAIITEEIDNNRPCIIRVQAPSSEFSMPLVLDGYLDHDTGFFVHLNWSARGVLNGWYDLFSQITHFHEDLEHRTIITIHPREDS